MMTDKEKIKELQIEVLRDKVRQYEIMVNEKMDELMAHRVAMIKIEAAINEYWEEMKKIHRTREKGSIKKTNRIERK